MNSIRCFGVKPVGLNRCGGRCCKCFVGTAALRDASSSCWSVGRSDHGDDVAVSFGWSPNELRPPWGSKTPDPIFGAVRIELIKWVFFSLHGDVSSSSMVAAIC